MQGALGNRSLLLWEIGKHGAAMGSPGLETLGLGPLWQFRWRCEIGTRASFGAGPAVWPRTAGAIAPGSLTTCGLTFATWRPIAVATWPAVAFRAVASRWPVAAVTAGGTVTAVVAITLGKLLGDGLERLVAG